MSAVVDFLAATYSPGRMAARLNIANSTWAAIRSGTRLPTPGILSRINAAYSQIQTNRLSRAGFSPSQISKLRRQSPDSIDDAIDIMGNLVNTIAAKMQTPDPSAVRASIRGSDKSWSTIEERFAEGWY